MKLSSNPRWILLLALLTILIGAGCTLQGGKEADTLPTAGYDTFKMIVDDVGPSAEYDASGFPTERRGFYYDKDLDGVGDYFYQLSKPTAGIIGLAFGDDGYASAGKAFALAKFRPGQTIYEVPLDSLTKWIRASAAVGYRKGRYIDDPNVLVFNDRVKDEEVEAPLTGKRSVVDFQVVNMGVFTPGGKSGPAPDEGDDIDTSAFDVEDARCPDFERFCKALNDTGYHENGWTVDWCMQNMYFRHDANVGTRYNTCLLNCDSENSRGGMESCVKDCQYSKLDDIYGCAGEFGPELDDAVYLLETPDGPFEVEKGYTVTGSDKLTFMFDYKDAECNFNNFDEKGQFHIGQIIVEFTEGGNGRFVKTLPVKGQLGCNSYEDKRMFAFTFGGLREGNYSFTVHLADLTPADQKDLSGFDKLSDTALEEAVANLKLKCTKEGNAYQGSFSVSEYEGSDDTPSSMSTVPFELYQIYETKIDPYNIGKGFIDVSAADPKFIYNLGNIDLGIIQGYIWSVIGNDTFDDWTLDDLNKAIFGTTQNTRGTKFDGTDDITSYAFYIDQPMSSGMYSFYGDTGWNLYPKAGYGDNSDQPFVRGDFADTYIYVPFKPFNAVNKYDGCYFDGSTWAEFVYGDYPYGMTTTFTDAGGNEFTKKEFQAVLEQNSATGYYQCIIKCLRRLQSNTNGCETMDECFAGCEGEYPPNGKDLCAAGYLPLLFKMTVTIPEAFYASEKYMNLFTPDPEDRDWQPLRVGLYAQGTSNPLPGGTVEFDPNKTEYTVPFPYFPYLPKEYLSIDSATSSGQAQIYVGIMDSTNTPYGISYNPPGGSFEDYWTYLAIWSYNWTSPEMEGWALGTVEGNSITGLVDPSTVNIQVTFGSLQGIGRKDLEP